MVQERKTSRRKASRAAAGSDQEPAAEGSPGHGATPVDSAPRYAAPALEKGLDILELLADSTGGETLNEIARKLHRSVSEIFRMVVTLQRRGYVHADEYDRYALTLKMFELAHRQVPLRSLVAMAMPLMRELASQARQSCHLTVAQGGRVVVIAQVDSPERWSFGLKVGALVGMRDTASGHVLLAFRDAPQRRYMLHSHTPVEGEIEIDDQALDAALQTVQRQGYAATPSQQIRGVTNIAYPVFGSASHAIACLNVPYVERVDHSNPPSMDEVRAAVDSAARKLSAFMGYSGYAPETA